MEKLLTCENAFLAMRQKCSEDGKTLMQQTALNGTLAPLNFCYKPSQPEAEVYGELRFIKGCDPIPFDFVDSGLRIGIDIPYANYFSWVSDRSRSLPVLFFIGNL